MLYVLSTMLSQIHELKICEYRDSRYVKSNRYIYIAELMIKVSERNWKIRNC